MPSLTLRKGEDIFLDDITLEEFKQKFPEKNIHVVEGGKQLRELLSKGVN